MILVGVTGQTGSGKSTFADVFREIGAKVIDADKLGHTLYNIPEIKEQIIESFGDEILDDEGNIIRSILAEIVFSDKKALDKLTRITEKPLITKLQAKIYEIKEDGFPGVVIVDAALLPRWTKLFKQFDFIVLVEAPRWQRINRLVENRDMLPDDAEQRIDVLENLYENFYPHINYNIKNSGNLHEFRAKVVKVWLDIKKAIKQ